MNRDIRYVRYHNCTSLCSYSHALNTPSCFEHPITPCLNYNLHHHGISISPHMCISFSLPRLKGSRLLHSSVEHRLRMLIPYLNKWPQAMALKGFPSNIPSSVEMLALMVDDMWYWAGDRSTDFSWYTKRALLTAVYTATGIHPCVCLYRHRYLCVRVCNYTVSVLVMLIPRASPGPRQLSGLPRYVGLSGPEDGGHWHPLSSQEAGGWGCTGKGISRQEASSSKQEIIIITLKTNHLVFHHSLTPQLEDSAGSAMELLSAGFTTVCDSIVWCVIAPSHCV